MNRILATAIAITLAITLVPAPAAGEDRAEYWMLRATADGLEIVPASAVPTGANQVECAGSAPDVTHCTTGAHTASEVWAVALGASFGYTGSLEVRLFHATSVLVFQVHVIDGMPLGGTAYGEFPITPVFWHECFSYGLGETGDNPTPLPFQENGTPGGTGDWDCFVLYP